MIDNERKAHWACFLECHKSGKEPISDVHSHMKMLNICHLAGISARLGRSLKWNDKTEQIEGDELANSMLKRPYREGYEIEMPKPSSTLQSHTNRLTSMACQVSIGTPFSFTAIAVPMLAASHCD